MKRKPNAPPIEFTCAHCGTKFFAPERLAPKYCSKQCVGASQTKRESRSCVICGTEYIVRPSSRVRVCSHVCKNKLNSISNTDESTHTTSACPECQKPFTYHASWPRKYCCKTCAAKNTVTNFKNFIPSAFTATCETCGKEFETTPKKTRGRFCSLACYGKWMSTNNIGMTRGKKLGRPAALPPPFTKDCQICGKTFVTKASHSKRRKCCSKACSAKLLEQTTTGENNPLWRGGATPYYGPDWRKAQREARERDKCCVDCGITPEQLGRELDVHHIKPFRAYGVDNHILANSLDNLVCLCNFCHTKREWTSGNRQQSFEPE